MTTAWTFAGQGVDPPWIDAELVARASSRPLAEAASDACGADVAKLLVRGGAALARVEILQPALVAACLMAAAAIEAAPAIVCGHSLGELSAWAASGAIAPTDAIAAAAIRGRLMAREAARHPGGMVALAGAAEIARAIACGAVIAADNAPDETVVSGPADAIAAVLAGGGKRLPVAGAWHSPAMAGAVDELQAALAALPRHPPRAPIVCNRDGAVADPAEVPRLLAEQLTHPVQWRATLRTLAALGVTKHVIVGPGRLMRALLRTNLGDVEVAIVERERDLARVIA